MVEVIHNQKHNEILRKKYIKALNDTLDELKNNTENLFDDMFDRYISNIEINIKIEPGEIVGYDIIKHYHTKVGDE